MGSSFPQTASPLGAGFTSRGFNTKFYEWPELESGQITVEPSTLVVGGAGAVRHALSRLGVKTPAIEDLPEPLAMYRGRRIWHETWEDVRRRCDEAGPPVFVKPLRDPKAFQARLVGSYRDLIELAHLPTDMPVLVSEPVEFVAEWRFFVCGNRIIGTGWYYGDPLVYPDPKVVREAVQVWGADAPAGYGIDFGVVASGATCLVEVNDGYSLGCLGLRPQAYTELLEARWLQLVSRNAVNTE